MSRRSNVGWAGALAAARPAVEIWLTALTIAALTSSLPGCTRPGPAPRDPPPADRSAELTPLDVRMHANISSVRTIHAALLGDDLVRAREQATRLSRLDPGGDVGKWAEPTRFLRTQAARVARARDAGEARRLATELAVTCADCHMVYAREATFRMPPMPEGDGSLTSAMARHEWAAERMWLGIVAPSTALWSSGLEAITDVPLASDPELTRAARLEAERFRKRLVALRESHGRELAGQNDRARRLAAVLDACAGCHAATRR
jgi:cytochrome c553